MVVVRLLLPPIAFWAFVVLCGLLARAAAGGQTVCACLPVGALFFGIAAYANSQNLARRLAATRAARAEAGFSEARDRQFLNRTRTGFFSAQLALGLLVPPVALAILLFWVW
jgi:hypothetical protein